MRDQLKFVHQNFSERITPLIIPIPDLPPDLLCSEANVIKEKRQLLAADVFEHDGFHVLSSHEERERK